MIHPESSKIIKTVAVSLNLKVAELAEQTGINKQQMYDYTMGKTLPKWEVWRKLKMRFPNVSGDYLLTGQGSPLLD